MTTIDCKDPKNKNNILCQSGNIVILIVLMMVITLWVWLFGGIITFLIWNHSHAKHRNTIIITGILISILIAPIGISLLQKYANWPLRNL